MKMKRFAAAMLAAMMTVSLGACGQSSDDAKQTSESKSSGKTTVERPEAVSEEDWEAMQKEPAFGTELNYLFNGGACVSAKYLAEELGYYEEYVLMQLMFRVDLLWRQLVQVNVCGEQTTLQLCLYR